MRNLTAVAFLAAAVAASAAADEPPPIDPSSAYPPTLAWCGTPDGPVPLPDPPPTPDPAEHFLPDSWIDPRELVRCVDLERLGSSGGCSPESPLRILA